MLYDVAMIWYILRGVVAVDILPIVKVQAVNGAFLISWHILQTP